MDRRAQDAYWPDVDGPGGRMRIERHYDGRMMRCYTERPASLDAMFRASLASRRDSPALVIDDRTITYAELGQQVDRVAANLAARGLQRGDRVVVLIGNRPEFLVTVLACARLAAVSVPVGTRQALPEVAHVVDNCGARAIVFEAEFAAAAPAVTGQGSLQRRILVGGGEVGNGAAVTDAEPFEALLADAPVPPALDVDEEDAAVLLYTSGTTGRPKGAILTHLGFAHSVIHFARCYGLDAGTRTLLAVPASHVTGLVALLLATVHVGGCTVILRQFKARDFLVKAERHAITYTLMVPAMYLLCLREPDFDRADLSAWRIGGFGGSPMPEAAISDLARHLPGLALRNTYGATETTSPTSTMPHGMALELTDSVGQVVPCGEVIIVDEAGQRVPPGAPGEVCIAGPMVVPGYWNNAEANARNFVDGFWRSGDVGSLDARGFLRVFDRIKDMINRGGFKIYSAEVENILSRHPDVLECAVFGVPDPVLSERVKAVIVARSQEPSVEELRAFCAQFLADYKVPEIVTLSREPLPRNANGKVQKNWLRSQA